MDIFDQDEVHLLFDISGDILQILLILFRKDDGLHSGPSANVTPKPLSIAFSGLFSFFSLISEAYSLTV